MLVGKSEGFALPMKDSVRQLADRMTDLDIEY